MGPANLPHGTHRVQCFETKVRDICKLQLNFKTSVQSLSRSFLKLPWSSSCQSSEQGKSIHQKKFSKDFGLRAVRLVSGVVVQVLGFKHEIRLTGHNFHSASKETISAGRPVSIYVQIDFYKWMQELHEYFAWNLFVYSSSNIIWRLCRLDGELESFLAFLADRLLIRTWGWGLGFLATVIGFFCYSGLVRGFFATVLPGEGFLQQSHGFFLQRCRLAGGFLQQSRQSHGFFCDGAGLPGVFCISPTEGFCISFHVQTRQL